MTDRYYGHLESNEPNDDGCCDWEKSMALSAIREDLAALVANRDKQPTMYNGKAGVAFLFYVISEHYDSIVREIGDELGLRDAAMRLANRANEQCRRRRDIHTLLEGDSGAQLVSYLLTGESQYYRKLVDGSNRAFDCDEVLYGRAGYVAALLVAANLSNDTNRGSALHQQIRFQSETLLADGCSCRRDGLFYKWHGKEYIGACHGYAGILNVLNLCDFGHHQRVLQCVANLAALARARNGRMPSREDSQSDTLVQWCHGATGFVALFHRFGFAEEAELCAEDLWQRGVLKKGVGICHGTSGNGLALLAQYRYTGDSKWLGRATKFARLVCRFPALREATMNSDHPSSLFNGIGGRVLFLLEVMAAQEGKTSPFESFLIPLCFY